ncbi:MAG: beta-propeller domain-containing protein [Nanoarchaeota archaeon]|nr:beta-propeller domain-containing protein [Nanoarchaeota archaeon]
MKNQLYAIIAFTLLVLTACSPIEFSQGSYDSKVFDPEIKLTPITLNSEAEFNQFIETYATPRYDSYDGGIIQSIGTPDSAIAESTLSVKSVAPAKPTDFSQTNNQVLSVDEADIIKTDGNYIYTASGTTLFIVRAYPGADAEITSRIDFKDNLEGLFINANHLAVFGNFNNVQTLRKVGIMPNQAMTFLNIYNIEDKANPELIKEFRFDGRFFRARMIEDYLYFITTTYLSSRTPPPIVMEGTQITRIAPTDISIMPIPYDNPQLNNIHAIKLSNPDEITSKAIAVEGSQNMYMSESNIYLTHTEYIDEWKLRNKIVIELIEPKLPLESKQLIQKIKNADNDLLAQYEKEQKIFEIISNYLNYHEAREELEDEIESKLKRKLESYKHLEFTIIQKIGVDGGNINIETTGKVPGSLNNQFSLDENNGILRIATTLNQRGSRFQNQRSESTNNVYTLDKNLNRIGELTDLAEGERIFSTRFIGDRVYMVTFRQTDPFFVIDLSTPQNIKELGQLKIPGFSRYLHPYDKDTIIGIGRDATDTGRTKGIKISLFNVKDVANPKEVAQYVSEERYSQTSAEWEHKAFLFSKEKNLLVIPAYNYEWENKENNYNGAMVFNIEADNIELRGLIDHSQDSEEYYTPRVERSLYIEELLYTKSAGLLKINKLEDLNKVKNIKLTTEKEGPIKIY